MWRPPMNIHESEPHLALTPAAMDILGPEIALAEDAHFAQIVLHVHSSCFSHLTLAAFQPSASDIDVSYRGCRAQDEATEQA